MKSDTGKKKGGSALSNLKATLKAQGVIGFKQASKKQRSQQHQQKDLTPKARAKLALRNHDKTTSASNPFEMQFTRPKHDVLGRKVKGTVGKPMLQRRKAEENRKKTIAVELQRKQRESVFVDKRFGENNPALSVEDRMMERFMREKTKSSSRNASLFNLEEEDLTHMGQSISGMDDFALESGLQRVDDDEEGNIDKQTVKYSHFGGFEDDGDNKDHKKSKNEIMQEIIAKSKFHKQERQKLNDEVQQLAQEVDADLDDIKSLLLGGSGDASPKETAEKPRRAPLTSQADDYDKFLYELKGDAKATPSNRLKTDEEKAVEEKLALEKLEAERLDRMNRPTKGNKKRAAQGDDLDDDFGPVTSKRVSKSHPDDDNEDSDDEEEEDENENDDDEMDEKARAKNAKPLTYSNDGILVNKEVFMRKRSKKNETDNNESESDGGDDDEEDDDDDDDESQSEDEELENGLEYNHNDTDRHDNEDLNGDFDEGDLKEEDEIDDDEAEGDAIHPEIAQDAASTIPYTFKAPESHADLLQYVKHLSASDQATVIHRIRVLYHVKLGGTNRQKLQMLLKIVFEHIQYLSRQVPADLETVNSLMKHLHELSIQFPQIATDYCLNRIKKLHSSVQKASDKSIALPWIDDIVLLKIIGAIFSVSDFDHAVATRAFLLMSEYLVMCPVKTGRQALSGLALCLVLRDYVKSSKRYIPEVVRFLGQLVDALTSTESLNKQFSISTMKAKPISLDLAVLLAKPEAKKQIDSLAFKTDGFKIALLAATVTTIADFSRTWSDIPAFIESFMPLKEKLAAISFDKSDESVKLAVTKSLDLVKGLLASAKLKRKPLQLQKRKAIAIATYVPKFQEHYSLDRRSDPNKDRAEARKVKSEYKKEFKGAIRELRKDGKFVARQRLQERADKAAVYKSKMDRIMGDLANLEGAMRGYEKMNKK